MKRILFILMTLMTAGLTGCHHLDTKRIPPAPVWLVFNTVAEWNTYGVPGALSHKRFIKEERIPANYPYTASSLTGYGGLLIVGDIHGAPRCYDLSCPVECRRDVRIKVDTSLQQAVCPKCGSTYDIFSNYGVPLTGPAAEYGYALTQYYIGAGNMGQYMVATRL